MWDVLRNSCRFPQWPGALVRIAESDISVSPPLVRDDFPKGIETVYNPGTCGPYMPGPSGETTLSYIFYKI